MVELPRDPANAMEEGTWDTGYALASAYFPGLSREDFYAFASDYSLAMAEWDDMVGRGKPKRRNVERFSQRAFGIAFCLLRYPRPPGEWTPDDDRGNIVLAGMRMAGVTSLLDFGGGVASMAISLARRGYQVGYIDIGEMAAFARWRIAHERLRASHLTPEAGKVACYYNLEEALGVTWGGIAALDVLEHTWDPVGLLRTFHAALPAGGLLCLTRHSFKQHPTHLERTFWLFDKVDNVLADIGFSPLIAPDPHYGIGSWLRV